MLHNPEQEIVQQLGSSESLLWSGKPRKGIIFRGSDIFLIPFSIMVCGFAIYWEYTAVRLGAPFFFMLWGIPFVLIGLYFVFGRFFFEAKQREKTYYGLTTERIIIISGIMKRKIKTLNLKNLNEVSLSEKSDKSGTITFGESNPLHQLFGGMTWPGMSQYAVPSFEAIDNVRQVHEMIRKAQKGA